MNEIKPFLVLDSNLEPMGIFDSYISFLWKPVYNGIGECEIYVPASSDNLEYFRKNNFILTLDNDMVCRIEKLEIDTDEVNGDYFIATGYDVKKMLNQRIIWDTIVFNGSVSDYIKKIFEDNITNPNDYDRIMNKPNEFNLFTYVDSFSSSDKIVQQTSYEQVGDKITDICNTFDIGQKVSYYEVDGIINYNLYKGEDLSDSVIFSPRFENLITSKYVEDATDYANVALVAGEGEGTARKKVVCGLPKRSLNRYEIYVDARDLGRSVKFGELKNAYPNGTVSTTNLTYSLPILDILIWDDYNLSILRQKYPSGTVVIRDEGKYYRLTNFAIADFEVDDTSETFTYDDDSTVLMRDIVYEPLLISRGYEKLGEHKITVSFDAEVEPNVTFKYRDDYNLGDIVSFENGYGIQVKSRLVEVLESWDESGYRLELTFDFEL